MSTAYGPEAATQADAARASMRTAAVNADRTATATDREAAAEREMAAYESYWHAHGVPAYAETSARHGLIREHAERSQGEIRAAEPEYGDLEPGS
jgi:hypothetical protein